MCIIVMFTVNGCVLMGFPLVPPPERFPTMWITLLLIYSTHAIFGKLTGPNICPEEIRYSKNVTESYLRNSTIRTYQWCLNVPPRCSSYSTKLVNDSRIVEKQMTDLIEKCCPGYTESPEKTKCIQECPDCAHGECIAGGCDCKPGWTGPLCTNPCPGNSHGKNCTEKCNCTEYQSCHHIKGCETIPPQTPQSIQIVNNGKFHLISTTESQPFTPKPHNFVSVYQIEDFSTQKNKIEEQDEEENLDSNSNDLVNGASAATAISVAIIIAAVVIVVANHVKKRGKMNKRGENKAMVSVYTHSIFHTPLPDPPPFENPTFSSSLEKSEMNPSGAEAQCFETHVVCSMNFPTHPVKGDYVYDHPQSTGSYRAASLPEPPDLEIIQPLHAEPLYDEIPSGLAPTPISQPPPSYKSSSLYMNTCAKTRL